MAEFYSPRIATRTYLSSHHLWAAGHFCRLAKEIEDANEGGRPKFNIKHRSYVTGAVLSAVAFLDAVANELFQDAADSDTSYIKPLGDQARERLEAMSSQLGNAGVLKKFKIALICLDRNHSSLPYDDVNLVVRLRNALTHFRPKTQYSEEINALGEALSKKFEPNRLMKGSGNAYFPDHCLSASCAEWTVATVRIFADSFFDCIGMTPNYQMADLSVFDYP